MRKPSRLPLEELAPYQWEPPGAAGRIRWGEGPRAEPEEVASEAPADPPPAPIDWAALFGNANPVEIEVGFGKGLFLVTSGVAHPDRNYFGIEIVRKYQLYATNRVAVRKLANVRTCCADAKRVLRGHVAAGSVAAVHVYFPDPWWKARHKKRTLFTTAFAEDVWRVLAPGGVFHFATDVPDYFAMAAEVMAALLQYEPLPPPEEAGPAHDMDYLTNFERRFRKQGKPIHRSRHAKGAPPGGS